MKTPPENHAAWKLMDMDNFAEAIANRRMLPTFRQALLRAKVIMNNDPAIRAVNILLLRADGQLWLVAFGPKGGWKRIFNFGK